MEKLNNKQEDFVLEEQMECFRCNIKLKEEEVSYRDSDSNEYCDCCKGDLK